MIQICPAWRSDQTFLASIALSATVGVGSAQSADWSAPSSTAHTNVNPWIVQVEIDPAQTTSNSLQKPNNARGTRFDVVDYAGKGSTLGRFTLAHTVDWGRAGSELRFDIVPFQQSGTRPTVSTVRYDRVTFQAGLPLTVLYQFNTYRLTYDLPVFRDLSPDWSFRVGATLALRDAQTRLSQPGARANYVNYGPVPLFYAASSWRWSVRGHLEADFDTFPAPGGGGLLDTSVRGVWTLAAHGAIFAGVRYEAGGATQDSIYTFFHQRSALAGVRFTF